MKKERSISVVTTVYKSSAYLTEFYERTSQVLENLDVSYEIIFVNDGSPDESEQVLQKITKQDRRVRLVNLSRNFGHFKAAFVGLEIAVGDIVFLTDCDLEEPPEILPRLWEVLNDAKAPYDLVGAYQVARQRRGLYPIFADLFYAVLNFAGNLKSKKGEFFSRLMTQQFVQELLRYSSEESLLLTGVSELTGFRQTFIPHEKAYKGRTSHTVRHNFALVLDAVTSFSAKPLFLISLFGLAMVAPAIVLSFGILIRKLFFTNFAAGWTSLFASIWFIGGANIMCMGIVGIYVGKIFAQVKGRPNASVRSIVNEGLAKKRKAS